MKAGKLRTKFIGITFIGIISLIIVIFLVINSENLSAKNNASIIILDINGNEIYRIEENLNKSIEDEVIITDDGVADSIISQVIVDLQNKEDLSFDKAIDLLNSKEYKIYSTIDMLIQEKVNNSFNDRSIFTTTKKNTFNQAAMVIMDYDGNVKAIATGNNGDTSKNRAATELIKVGSTIKPISIYSLAIEKDLINFSTIIDDMPRNTTINGKAIEWPTNYDNKYETNVTITEALKKSKNTIAVRVGEMIGQEEVFDFLKEKLNYSTLIESKTGDTDKQLSALALGYFTRGTTLDTLVSSYSMIGNGGYYSGKRYYTKVIDSDGDVLISNEDNKERVISEEVATVMNRLLLNNIVDEDSIIKDIKIDEVEILGKTGTIGNDRGENISQLFVGMTPDYIVGVWVGYDDRRALMQDLYNHPTKIWQSVMSNIELKNNYFKLSNNVKKLDYCSESGLLKSDSCENIKTGYYKESNIPDICNIHN